MVVGLASFELQLPESIQFQCRVNRTHLTRLPEAGQNPLFVECRSMPQVCWIVFFYERSCL